MVQVSQLHFSSPMDQRTVSPVPTHPFLVEQSKITREELENQRQLLVDLRHEIGELKSIHQAGVVGSKGGGTRGGYGTAMPASEFFKQGVQILPNLRGKVCSTSLQSPPCGDCIFRPMSTAFVSAQNVSFDVRCCLSLEMFALCSCVKNDV